MFVDVVRRHSRTERCDNHKGTGHLKLLHKYNMLIQYVITEMGEKVPIIITFRTQVDNQDRKAGTVEGDLERIFPVAQVPNYLK